MLLQSDVDQTWSLTDVDVEDVLKQMVPPRLQLYCLLLDH